MNPVLWLLCIPTGFLSFSVIVLAPDPGVLVFLLLPCLFSAGKARGHAYISQTLFIYFLICDYFEDHLLITFTETAFEHYC